jgi:hypothetical protein
MRAPDVELTLSRQTVETIRACTRARLKWLEERAETAELRGVSGCYWRVTAKVVEEALVELEDRYSVYLRRSAAAPAPERPHAPDCHCNRCCGALGSPFPSEPIKYAAGDAA